MGRELHVHSHPSKLEHWRHAVEIAALVVAAVWGFYVFVYQERIKPASEIPRLQPELVVHHEKLSAAKEYVDVEIDVRNPGGTDVSLDGMIVNIYGRSMATRSAERFEKPVTGVEEINRTLILSPPKLLYSFYDIWRALGGPVGKVNTVRRGQGFRERIAFGIAPGSFDILKVTYSICYSRPGSATLVVHRERSPDGAYRFGVVDRAAQIRAGRYCGGQSRGEYFSV